MGARKDSGKCNVEMTIITGVTRRLAIVTINTMTELGAIGDQNDLFLGGSYRHYKSSRTVLQPPCLTLGWALGLEGRGAVTGDAEYTRHIGPGRLGAPNHDF